MPQIEVYHLTKDSDNMTAEEVLHTILRDGINSDAEGVVYAGLLNLTLVLNGFLFTSIQVQQGSEIIDSRVRTVTQNPR